MTTAPKPDFAEARRALYAEMDKKMREAMDRDADHEIEAIEAEYRAKIEALESDE